METSPSIGLNRDTIAVHVWWPIAILNFEWDLVVSRNNFTRFNRTITCMTGLSTFGVDSKPLSTFKSVIDFCRLEPILHGCSAKSYGFLKENLTLFIDIFSTFYRLPSCRLNSSLQWNFKRILGSLVKSSWKKESKILDKSQFFEKKIEIYGLVNSYDFWII